MNGNGAPDCPVCGRKTQKTGEIQKINEHLGRMNALVNAASDHQDQSNFYLALICYLVKEAGGEVRIPSSYLDKISSGEGVGIHMTQAPPLIRIHPEDVDLLLHTEEKPRLIVVPS